MPRHSARNSTVRERILRPDGEIDTIMLDERYAPYDRQAARIENLCGSFLQYAHSNGLSHVVSKIGGQKELFHLHGNVVLNQGRASFLAVRGFRGLQSIARALDLPSPRNSVHMAVLTSKIGHRAQVSNSGLLEAALQSKQDHIRIMGRIYEHTNSVGFSIHKFDCPPFHMPEASRPTSNDWTVTGKGMIIIRLVWKNIEWTQATEDDCLSTCNSVTEWLQASC